jgi:hypothetical protein
MPATRQADDRPTDQENVNQAMDMAVVHTSI